MTVLPYLHQIMMREYMFFSWKDGLEIFVLSAGIYYFLRWLRQDAHKHLVMHFYAYCGIFFASHFMGLQTVTWLFMVTAPAVFVIFFIIHQETLQKNFIAFKKIVPAQVQNHGWLDALLGALVYAMHKNRDVLCVIERTDSLEHFTTTTCRLNADIHKDFLQFLIDSWLLAADGMLWVDVRGKLVAVNTHWRHAPIGDDWVLEHAKTLPVWKQDAILITSKTDALIIHASVTTRLFTIITQGRCIEELTARHAYNFLHRYIVSDDNKKGRVPYAHDHTQSSVEQRMS